jgi:tripartite-type tricarboxylate transporter receptor subunit TctC
MDNELQEGEARYKSETFQTLTSMGYNYLLAEIAYQAAPIKTVEGVINYIDANPNLHKRVDEEIRAREVMAKTEA